MRTPPLLAVLCLLCWNSQSKAATPSALVRIACERDPLLSFCMNSETRAKYELVSELVPMNPKVRGVKSRVTRQDDERKEADLREKGHDSEEGFIPEREGSVKSEPEDTEEHRGSKLEKEDYCDRYEQHFSFYCTGDSNDGQQEAVTKFCPSYKRACPGKGATSGAASTAWPADPFRDTPKRRLPVKVEESEDESDEEPEVTEQELYYAELKRRFPCKPDCDKRLFPHCTAECKCDYLYPMVQRFCNPPPMPLFLNTCRLWYTGCPKYEAYHYSSQFVYSKAEKGKVLPGPQASNPNPYNIPQPPHSHRKRETSALLPIVKARARAATTFVIPPDLPDNFEEIRRKRRQRDEPVVEQEETVDVLEQVVSRKKPSRRHRRRKAAAPVSTTPSPRELFRSLRALNDLTKDPARLTKDLLGQGGGSDEPRPKALAANSGPPVVSDFGGNDPTFKQFDGLTDSRGILHRPRSSSPFTKPGLWEPNPNDPHSRDPTNKYAYHVRSTGVDWLNGQMTWGAHWAVPAAGVGGTDGFSALHFPSIGNFLQIPDDYD